MRGRKPKITPDPDAIKGAKTPAPKTLREGSFMTILDPLTGQTVSIERPPRNPRRAYDANDCEIPPCSAICASMEQRASVRTSASSP